MERSDVLQLNQWLFPRIQGSNLKLVFTTDKDGFSLASIYRTMQNYKVMKA